MLRTALLLFTCLAFVFIALGCDEDKTIADSDKSSDPVKTVEKTAKDAVKAPTGNGTVKSPVTLGNAPAKVKLDANASEWKNTPSMPAPYMKKKDSSVKLGWDKKGLCGIVVVEDKKINVNADNPWRGDCFEIWIDKDFSRKGDHSANSCQYAFAPAANGKDGKALIAIPHGTGKELDAGGVVAVWKKTKDGYVIEFLIPTKIMKPAKMKKGTKVGVNFAINNDGTAAEQFFCDKDTDESYSNPSTWGTVILVD